MKISSKFIVIFVSAMGVLMMTYQLISKASQTEEWCEAKWVSDSGRLISNVVAKPDYDGIYKQWLSYEPDCGKTVTYSTRLALIQMLQRNFVAAKATLLKVDNKNSAYGYLVDSAWAQLEIQEALANNKEITIADLLKFEGVYSSIVKKYHNWPNGYSLLGGMQTELGKYEEALINLEKAKKAQTYDLYYVYRNLTICNAALNHNEAALDAADKAVVLRKDLFSDPKFVIFYANASTKLGYLADTQNALKVLLAKHPEIESNAEFVKAVENYKFAVDKQK